MLRESRVWSSARESRNLRESLEGISLHAELNGEHPASDKNFFRSISLHVGEDIIVVDINGAIAELFVFNADFGAAVKVILGAIPDAE